MRPVGSNILIKQDPVDKGTIVLLESSESPPPSGTVVGVGPKVTEVTEGDRIIYRESFSATKVPGEKDLLVMHEDNVLLVL